MNVEFQRISHRPRCLRTDDKYRRYTLCIWIVFVDCDCFQQSMHFCCNTLTFLHHVGSSIIDFFDLLSTKAFPEAARRRNLAVPLIHTLLRRDLKMSLRVIGPFRHQPLGNIPVNASWT